MTPAPPYCPCCGFNFTRDLPVECDGWRVSTIGVEHDGKATRLTSCEALMLHSIAAARGVPASSAVLAERAGVDCDSNVVQVIICRLRKKLPGVPIETVHGQGYRWAKPLARAA